MVIIRRILWNHTLRSIDERARASKASWSYVEAKLCAVFANATHTCRSTAPCVKMQAWRSACRLSDPSSGSGSLLLRSRYCRLSILFSGGGGARGTQIIDGCEMVGSLLSRLRIAFCLTGLSDVLLSCIPLCSFVHCLRGEGISSSGRKFAPAAHPKFEGL